MYINIKVVLNAMETQSYDWMRENGKFENHIRGLTVKKEIGKT